MLKDTSQIKISGGCEVYGECCITFVPMGNDKITVQVDNSGAYFYDKTSTPVPSFELQFATEHLSPFIERWIALMDAARKTSGFFSTREATVLLDFSLQHGKVHFSCSESREGHQLDPMIESINAFVAICQEKIAAASPMSSEQSFSPRNRTENFLGSPEERDKVTLVFNDMNGLHGGRVIALTGTGSAMVQLVSFSKEHQAMWEKQYTFNISHARLNEIFTGIIDNDVMTIQLEDRPGIPDETRIHFSMSNGNDDDFYVGTWEQSSLPPGACPDSPRARFDKVCLALTRLAHTARTEKTPVQEGPHVHA